jgi:hypothetical protein
MGQPDLKLATGVLLIPPNISMNGVRLDLRLVLHQPINDIDGFPYIIWRADLSHICLIRSLLSLRHTAKERGVVRFCYRRDSSFSRQCGSSLVLSAYHFSQRERKGR